MSEAFRLAFPKALFTLEPGVQDELSTPETSALPGPASVATARSDHFAEWLRETLCELASPPFEFSEPIREGDEWDIVATCDDQSFCIELSYVDEGSPARAEWVVTIVPELDLNPFRHAKPDLRMHSLLRQLVSKAVEHRGNVVVFAPVCTHSPKLSFP